MASHGEVTPFPWLLPGEVGFEPGQYTRQTIVVTREFQHASIDACDDRLPESGRWSDSQNALWRRFELPSEDWLADSSPAPAEILMSGNGVVEQRVLHQLSGGLPRPSRLERDDLANGSSSGSALPEALSTLGHLIEEITDNHVEFVNDVWDTARPHLHYWEENVQGASLRSVRRTIARWRRSGLRDEARLALIVKLATRLPTVLQDVCLRPRVVLRRVRKMIGVSRVQETDASCLRWLARQPGRTVVEKAGSRQQVMGIARVEDADTPENRVVKDLLLRALIECRRYLSENRQYPIHYRVGAVRAFRTQIYSMLRDSPISRVGLLVGEAKANYVLQHESRYAMLWEAYLLLVRQQKLQEDIWRWRERTWSEVCQIAMWEALAQLRAGGSAYRSDVVCRDEQNAGTFMDDSFPVAEWELETTAGRIGAQVLIGSQLAKNPRIPREARRLCPDIAVVPSESGRGLLLFWTLLQAPSHESLFSAALERLTRRIEEISRKTTIKGFVLVPGPSESPGSASEEEHIVEIINLPMPVQRAPDRLARAVQQCWGL
jgi:hypothetical protein